MAVQHKWLKNNQRYLAALVFVLTLIPSLTVKGQDRIRITYASNSLAFLTAFVAKDRDFYAKNGLNVELVQVRPGVAIAALLSGDADYAEVLGSAIRSAARGAPIRAVSTSIKAPFFSLAAQPGIKSVKELKARSIGVTAIGGTNYISARLLLQHFGLDPDREAKIIAIGDEKLMYEALKIRRVDAVMVAPPFSVLLKREGFPLLAHTAQVLSIPFVGLSATLDKIRKNRLQVKNVLKAEVEALKYIHENPAGTTEVIRKRFAMDEAMARESYAAVVEAHSKDGRIPREGVEYLLNLEKKEGLIDKAVTVDQVVDFSVGEEIFKESRR
ncbi:MAG TPA: ABC transporter substrate-binding protein [Candidatus Binatia bacterium]|jgi:NitT/TauT family transport system substrate-binding protein|nr:ABC transporter substrate-binding protein [Candidatus Binatia bacterium]